MIRHFMNLFSNPNAALSLRQTAALLWLSVADFWDRGKTKQKFLMESGREAPHNYEKNLLRKSARWEGGLFSCLVAIDGHELLFADKKRKTML